MKAALVHTMAFLAASGFDQKQVFSNPKKQSTKPKFTDEELQKIKELSGKDKKRYVRELKERYLKDGMIAQENYHRND